MKSKNAKNVLFARTSTTRNTGPNGVLKKAELTAGTLVGSIARTSHVLNDQLAEVKAQGDIDESLSPRRPR